ncbi:MAG: esterase family protein [Bacteroidales bacterium]|nr:esterase family protein [Bacteroidales bacterium]
MKNRIIAIFVLCLCSMGAYAQEEPALDAEKIWGVNVGSDNSVTFRYAGPAERYVMLRGTMGRYPMTKGEEGVWSVTIPNMESDFYEYFYIVDDHIIPDPTNYYTTQSSGYIYSNFIVPGGKGDLYSTQDVPHGTVSRIWYHNDRLDMDRSVNIYLPAGYESSRRSYPVLYLLHGSSQFDNAWLMSGRAAQIMDNLIAAGECEPMIVVMPGGNLQLQAAPGYDTDNFTLQARTRKYLSKTNNGEWEAAFPSLVEHIDKHYRTKTGKIWRAIAGLSMGGAQSVVISANYPKMFGYVGCFSCYIMGSGEVVENIYDKIAKQLSMKPRLWFLTTGPQDELYSGIIEFKEKVDAMGYPYQWLEQGAGHDFMTWRLDLETFAKQLFR